MNNNCEIENEKSKVIRLDPETVWLLKKYKMHKGKVFEEILTDNQVIKAALREGIDNVKISNNIKLKSFWQI